LCYFSSISIRVKIIETRFGAKFIQSESFLPVYSASAFTFPSLPVISNEDPEHITFMQWGLIPFWTKNQETALEIREKTLNARAETIFEKSYFRQAAQSKRCLVIADGFFEWRHVNKQTYPYYIRLVDHSPFALAGLWDRWVNKETGEIQFTFSIVTTRANALLEKVHNTKKRMPVILAMEKERTWLDDHLDKDSVQSLLQPYETTQMEAFPVTRLVNKLGLNTTSPEVTNRQTYAELPDLF
jgi:putative SOS response-associated peptidase YedK